MKLAINIVVAIWMFFMSAFYLSLPLKLLAYITESEALLSTQLKGFLGLIAIGFLIAFVKQAKAGKIAVLVMLGITLFFLLRMLINMALTHNSPLTGKPYPPKAYITFSSFLLVNSALLMWQVKTYRANQGVAPTLKTPFDSVND